MAQFGSDAFGGTDGTELTAYNAAWSKNSAFSANNAVLITGRVRNNQAAGNPVLYVHSGTPASADYSVTADIYSMSSADGCSSGVVGRSSATVETNYHARIKNGVGTQLYKFVSGGATLLGTETFTVAGSTTYNLRLEMIGSTIKVYRNSTLVITATDTGITAAGLAGIKAYDVTAPGDTKHFHIDNYSADDAGSTSYTLTASAGTFSVTGTAATLKYGRSLSAAPGSFSVSGAASTLRRGYALSASSGSFAVSGSAATLKYGRVLPCSVGSFTVNGTDASLKYGRLLSTGSGTFSVTGTDATLIHGTAGNYTLTSSAGSFAATGTAATLKYGRRIRADAGSFAFTGTTASLRYARRVIAEAGSFAVTGMAATLTRSGGAQPIVSTVERTAIFRATVARGAKFQRNKSVSVKFN